MKPLFLIHSFCLLCLPAVSRARVIEETRLFTIQPSSITEVGMAAVSNGIVGNKADRHYSGDFQAIFSFDSETLEFESFKFNGGQIFTSGYIISFTGDIVYDPPWGQRFTIVQRYPNPEPGLPTYMRFNPQTKDEVDGLIEPDGTLKNTDHFLHADYGAQVTTRVVRGEPQPAVFINYWISPANLFFKGEATPTIEEISSTLYERSIRACLTIEIDEMEIATLPGNVPSLNLDVLETESGTVTSESFVFPILTAYGKWSIENGLIKPDPEELNESGIAYGILFALDLPADTTSLPISIENSPGGPIVKIILPESGLNSPMSVEHTTDLTVADWPALPDTYYLDGADSLDPGMTGEPTFGFPAGEIGFVRFATIIE